MKIAFNNVDFNSRSGPNGFGLKLARQLTEIGHEIVGVDPDVCLNFITGNYPGIKNTLRLDGIYFNTSQDWKSQNSPIKKSYDLAEEIIVQSKFNKKLVENYFGKRENIHVVHNGTSLEIIEKINPAELGIKKEDVWLCASSWRPHKRLIDNIKYFQNFGKKNDVLLVAGSGDISDLQKVKDKRIKYVGDLPWEHMISVMKSSKHFIHLAYLDHCPNVVIDARASGCTVHCTSSGGTKEIAGLSAKIVEEDPWDFNPIELYRPPSLDFTKVTNNNIADSIISIKKVSKKYERIIL